MTLRIVNGEQVSELLPMGECVDIMETAMLAVSTGSMSFPPRLVAPLPGDVGNLLVMPGSSPVLDTFGAKMITIYPGNAAKGLPGVQGFVSLFDRDTGAPVGLVDGLSITAIRTGAASGLATRWLAPESADSCGIFGTGTQARIHIDAMNAVRPLKKVLVWGRSFSKAQEFATKEGKRTGLDIEAVENPEEAAQCALLCTTTLSPTPVLKGDWVRSGTHVNLVGAYSLETREADTKLIVGAAVYVDMLEAASNEAGDVVIPIQEGAVSEDHVVGEIGQLINGEIGGRVDAAQITVYKSLGVVAQDLFAAQHVYDKAAARNVGTCAEL